MGYHPETLAFSFPPYPSGGTSCGDHPKPWSIARFLYDLSPWIGIDIWHIDPERRTEGQRTDDSCGWFDRRPDEYGDAVKYLLGDESTMEEIARSIATRAPVTHRGEYTYPRMAAGETLAVSLMVARELELRRWWNGQSGNGGAHASFWRRMITSKRIVDDVACGLALSPIDNLSSVDNPESLIGSIAGALHRRFKPWYRHPRWHVHHWQVQVHLFRNLKRMVEPCATCGKGLGFGYSPHVNGDGAHHSECLGIRACATEKATA